MIKRNEDALICDFAETYHVLDYRGLPLKLAATLAAGLPSDSRIKRYIGGQKQKTDTILLAATVDALNTLVWFKTEDGQKGRNRPVSVLRELAEEKEDDLTEFGSIEAYEAARKRIMES